MFRELVSGFPHRQRLWSAAKRFGQLLLPLGILVILLAPLRTYDISTAGISPVGGYAYVVSLSKVDRWGDSTFRPQQSRLVLLENGRALAPMHSMHAEIMEKGGGRFSHWSTALYFSASDNSDPRTNGRAYRVIVPNMWIEGLGWLAIGLGLAALVWPLFARRSDRADIERRRAVIALSVAGGAAGLLGTAIFLGLVGGDPRPTNEHFLSSAALRLGQPDLLLFSGLLVFGACLGWLRGGRNGARLGAFVGAATAVLVAVNAILLGSGPFWGVLNPDSAGYLGYNACRTPGYYIFLEAFRGIDLRWLVVVQVNLLVGALIAIAAGCASVTMSSLVGIATLLLGLAFGEPFVYAFHVLTEAPFTAALAVAIAAALAYLRSPQLWSAVVVGVAIAIATVIKASAPVLIVPAALLLLLPATRRSLKAVGLAGIPALCLLTLMTVARINHGTWSPTNFMGIALVGHVAYGIRGDELASNRDLSAQIDSGIRRYYEKWPPIYQLDDYVRASQSDYNSMLYQNILPIVNRFLPPQDGCTKEYNEAVMTLSKEAILRFPGWFLGHAAAHYYGLWSYAFIPSPLNQLVATQRHYAAETQQNMAKYWIPQPWQASSAQIASLKESASVVGTRPLYLSGLQGLIASFAWLGTTTAMLIGFAATIAALGMFILPRLPSHIAAPVVVAGFMVPYLATNALLQVALTRYTAPASFGIAAFTTLTGFALISRFTNWLSGRSSQSIIRAKLAALARFRDIRRPLCL